MEKLGFLICSLVGFLGLLAVLLGIVAEVKRIKAHDILIDDNGVCYYPSSPSKALGIVSALALLAAEVIINAAVGCVCCCGGLYQSICKKTTAIICLVLSWITFLVAFSLLLDGAVVNGRQKSEIDSLGNYGCYFPRSGIFAGGAVLALVSITLGISYYILTSEMKKSTKEGSIQNQNIAMAQPYPVQP